MLREEFAELSRFTGENCVSIYMPTHKAGLEVNEKQDAIRFKNALQAAEAQLETKQLDKNSIQGLLSQGYELYNDQVFWNNQTEGLAVFIALGFYKTVKLPFGADEEVFVNSSFHTGPLLPLITQNQPFYLLAISKRDARFYQGDAFGLERVEVEGLPNGMEDVVHFEEKDGRQLFRRGGTGAGEPGANFHGHGEGQPDDKANAAIYFQEVDKTLFTEVLHDKHAPLVLAGVEYLIPIYKGVSKYQHICEEGITGNQEHESEQHLFEKAKEKLQPYFKEQANKLLQNYYNQIATPLTSSIPEKVIPASFYAQISDLFVCKGEHIWGTFNETDNALEIHSERQDGDECLLHKAAVNTYLNGGSVTFLDREKMPKDSIIAAFMRF